MRTGEYKGTVQLSSTQETFSRFVAGEQFEEDARHTCSSVLSSGIFILSDRQALRLDAWKEQPADSSKPYVTKCSLTKLEVHVYKACPMCAGRVEPTFVVGQNFQCTKCSHQCDGSFEESYISVVITGACAGGVQEELTGKAFGAAAKVLIERDGANEAIGNQFLMKISVAIVGTQEALANECTISEVCAVSSESDTV